MTARKTNPKPAGKKGMLIAFEGIDGSGKSTQARMLYKHLQGKGVPVWLTAEPTSNQIGTLIRQGFSGELHFDHRTIAGLFVADRLDHILNPEFGMKSKVDQGFIVICDRYYLSSFAYQGSHMPMKWVMQANSLAMDLLKPDLTIFIDVPAKLAMQRIHENRSSTELYETEKNLRKVKSNYKAAIALRERSERIVSLSGKENIDTLHRKILSLVDLA